MKWAMLSILCLLHTSLLACDDVQKKVVLVNTLGWAGGGYQGLASMMFTPDPINTALRERVTNNIVPYTWEPLDPGRRNTTQQLSLLQHATVIWIFAHASSQRIALEYHDTEEAARQSAIDQGLGAEHYSVESKHGKVALRVNIDGLRYLWQENMFLSYEEYCGLFIMGCD